MKRLMPSSLVTFLQENPNCQRADLFAITLSTGKTFYATSGQWDITVPTSTSGMPASWTTQTFSAAYYGVWNRGVITSEATMSLDTNTMDLTCTATPTVEYPDWSVSLLWAASQKLFLGAVITVYTCYMPSNSYGDVSAGIETKFYGYILKNNKLNRTSVTFSCGDPLYLCSLKVPMRLFQPMDCLTVYDALLGLSLGSTDVNGYYMTQAFTCAAGSTQFQLVPGTDFSQPDNYFTQGIVTCTAGANVGWSCTVSAMTTSLLTMLNPWPVAPVAGTDTFSVVVGYDGTYATCLQKFGVTIANNFMGTPFTPPANVSI